ncbi:MAG: respiratory nitrate reductase subunit gamma [Rhodospirillales bacterium]|nr:respiratory nitrate reductase subunit gamma [Rhodospirillales bacterium]
MNQLHEFLFGIYPYLAGAVFAIGSVVRFDYDPYSWKSGSSQMLSKQNMVVASNCFHVGILLLFFGHLVGLLTPKEVYHAFGLSAGAKQAIAMTAGGIFGLLSVYGLTMLVRRRLTDARVRATSGKMDIFILLLIYVQMILGLFTILVSSQHMDGSVMVALADWAQAIVFFQGGAAASLTGVHWLYKMHILVGVTMFLVFPFSRLVHIWSAPVAYLGRSYQLVRRRA